MMLRLLHLCDSLFPLGAFAHSEGLETATAGGAIATVDALRDWIDVCLDETIARTDGPTAWRAWPLVRDARWQELEVLDAEAIALRPSASGRRSTRAMGQRLLSTWCGLYPDPHLETLQRLATGGALAPTFPVAFAAACATSDVDRSQMLHALAYTRLAATVSASMRLAPIGQHEAHALLARTLDRVPAIMAAIAGGDAVPESFTPAVDIAAMSQQYLHSRLFLS
jgi:urease accessory protein